MARRNTPTTRRRRSSGSARKSAASLSAPRRAQVVWMAFMAAMTVVGGLLLLLEDRPSPRVDGRSLAPLLAADGPTSIESVFRTRATLDRARWQAVVIHHSGSAVGSPTTIAADHEARNAVGLGHHFVIGNGSGMADGEVHVGFRWDEQLPGFHAAGEHGDWHNLHSISICLVGDGNRRGFSQGQLRRLVQLVSALNRELGIPADRVYLHSDVAPTSDPGRLFPAAAFYEQLGAGR